MSKSRVIITAALAFNTLLSTLLVVVSIGDPEITPMGVVTVDLLCFTNWLAFITNLRGSE